MKLHEAGKKIIKEQSYMPFFFATVYFSVEWKTNYKHTWSSHLAHNVGNNDD